MIHIPYVWPMFLSAILLAAVFFLSLRYRGGHSLLHFRVMVASSIMWCVSYALAVMSERLGLRLAFTHAMITATAAVPPAILLFAIEYTRGEKTPGRKVLPALYLPTLAFSVAEWSMFPAFKANHRMDLSSAIPLLVTDKGPLYWAFVAFGSLYSLSAIAILLASSSASPSKLRSSLLFSAGILLPLGVTVLDSLGFTPVKGLDFSPATMGVTAILFMFAILRNRMLGIVPIARTLLFNGIRDPVVVVDGAAQILDYNQAAADAMGPTLDAAPGSLISTLAQPWNRILSAPSGDGLPEGEFWIGDGDGADARCYQLASTTLADDHGRPVGTMFVLHDATAAKHKERALEKYAAEVERANLLLEENARLREDMERIMSHDIRAPLTGVISLPELLLRDEGLSQDQRETLALVIKSGQQILDMVNRSLDFYRMENGSYEVAWATIDLLESVDQVLATLSDPIQKSGCPVSVTVDGRPKVAGEDCAVRAERMLLCSLLSNLIKNALEASPAGAPVTIAVQRGRTVLVSIVNQGEIPPSVRERLFKKGATSGKRGGTGLGLYSANLHARTLGATLSLDSSVPGRTTARVEFATAEGSPQPSSA